MGVVTAAPDRKGRTVGAHAEHEHIVADRLAERYRFLRLLLESLD